MNAALLRAQRFERLRRERVERIREPVETILGDEAFVGRCGGRPLASDVYYAICARFPGCTPASLVDVAEAMGKVRYPANESEREGGLLWQA